MKGCKIDFTLVYYFDKIVITDKCESIYSLPEKANSPEGGKV